MWMGPPADSDGELLCRVAQRDLAAFELLYGRYARSVYGLAMRRLADREGAADATERAFAAVWRSAAAFIPGDGAGQRWVFAVALNAVASGEPAAAAEDDWLAFCVHTAVAQLPQLERVLLELALWAGRSRSEIAEELGLPLGMVDTRTRRALALLAVRLEGL